MNFLIQHYLSEHATNFPDSIAFAYLDQQISYGELEKSSNQLANCLIELGVMSGARIGIYMDKSLELSHALYGILKSGAAYVPLDPTAPVERLSEIIEDCGIEVVISSDNKAMKLQQVIRLLKQKNNELNNTKLLSTVIGLTGDYSEFKALNWQAVFSQFSQSTPQAKIIESDLAYIIYTSGSTGKPKGIMHTHHSCLSYSRWAASEYKLCPKDRLGNHSPLHFDISIFDLFAGVVAGSCTVFISEEYTKFPASFSQLIADSQMTVLFTVPYALVQLVLKGVVQKRELTALRWIIFGGEPFPMKYLVRLKQLLPQTQLDNMYGPAEVNGCTRYTIKELSDEATAIPIGKVCDIALSLVVDEEDNQVKVGDIGELLIRSPTMMQGYWGRDDLNQRAFYRGNKLHINHSDNGHIYYRTGDLVKEGRDGEMWFIGRKDRQIKVRGYRIELDEIESVLVAHHEVAEAAAFMVKTDDFTTEIYAAYIPSNTLVTQKTGMKINGFRKYLKSCLPHYAVPSLVQVRSDFPRTTTGKVNRVALSRETTERATEVVDGNYRNNDC